MGSETAAGGIILDKLAIETIATRQDSSGDKAGDFRAVYDSISLFEDLYSNYVNGFILVTDTLNLPYNISLVGHEELRLRFKGTNPYGVGSVNQDWIDLKLFVHGITERAIVGEKSQTYALNFTTHAALRNNLVKVSQSFSGSIPNIVKQISVADLQEPIRIEVDSPSNFQCVIPYWPPVMAINWLASRCVANNSIGDSADCLFYQDRESMVFTSLSYLKSVPPKTIDVGGSTFYFQPAGTGDPARQSLQRTVENISIQPSFDTLSLSKEGTYSAQMASHDITRKKLTYHNPFSYEVDFSQRPQLEKNHMIPHSGIISNRQPAIGSLSNSNYSYSRYAFQPKNAHLFGDATNSTVHVGLPERWILQRSSELNQAKILKVVVMLAGDTAIRLGEVVVFKEFPTQQPSWPGIVQPKDEFLSGKFLVTAIHHMLGKGVYKMAVELTKDSLGKGIE